MPPWQRSWPLTMSARTSIETRARPGDDLDRPACRASRSPRRRPTSSRARRQASKSTVTGVADREGLAGQHELLLDLGGLEGVVAHHLDLAVDHLGAAGAAHPALAGERQVAAHGLRGVEHGRVARHRRGRRTPVEDDGDVARHALDDAVGVAQRRRRLVDEEELEVDLLRRHAELGEHRAGVLRSARAGRRATRGRRAPSGTLIGSSRRSRSASRRPENSSTSRGSRESTWTRSKRGPWRFLRSLSSSANITDVVSRLP